MLNMTETFIQHKDLLLTRYEYAIGDKPSAKVLVDRQKLADKGKVRVITDERDWEPGQKRKIERKK